MRSVALLFCIYVTAFSANAQNLSIGLRTGISYWPTKVKDPEISKGGHGFNWDKSLYGRYETKGRLAFDLDVSHNRFGYQYKDVTHDWFDAPRTFEFDRRNTITIYQNTLSGQVRITPKHSKIRSYFGVSIAGIYRVESYNSIVEDLTTKKQYELDGDFDVISLFCGLNNYTSYAVNQHLNIHSIISFSTDPSRPLSFYISPTLVTKFSCNIGLGYTF